MALAILPINQPGTQIRRVRWQDSRDPALRRQYVSLLEAAHKSLISSETVRKWVYEGSLSAVRTRGWLFVDRHELAAFLKRLPKPGTKTRSRVLNERRMMALRRLRRSTASHSNG